MRVAQKFGFPTFSVLLKRTSNRNGLGRFTLSFRKRGRALKVPPVPVAKNRGCFDVERPKFFSLRGLKQSPIGGSECDLLAKTGLEPERRG